ncbi:MAG TPA: hypothetical protein VF167_08445 [Longimicrobiaceae bacterium]
MVDRRSPIVRAAAFLLATSLLAGCNKIDAWRLARLRERENLLTVKIMMAKKNFERCALNTELNIGSDECPDWKTTMRWRAELDIVEREIRQILDEE